jgi:hypothetical protein
MDSTLIVEAETQRRMKPSRHHPGRVIVLVMVDLKGEWIPNSDSIVGGFDVLEILKTGMTLSRKHRRCGTVRKSIFLNCAFANSILTI